MMAYAYEHNGNTYYLHSKRVKLAGIRTQLIYYFRTEIDPDHAIDEVPDWMEPTVNYKNLPVLREKAKIDRPDFGLVHPPAEPSPDAVNYEMGRLTMLQCPNCGAQLLTDDATVWCSRLKPYCGFGLMGDVPAGPFLRMEKQPNGND